VERKARATAKSKTRKSQLSTKKAPSVQIDSEESHRRTRMEAYCLFKKRDRKHGHDWEDWFEAEKIVNSRRS